MLEDLPREVLKVEYQAAAEDLLESLPLEHFAQATTQANQHRITLYSMALVHAQCPSIQYFNELLVQYPVSGRRTPGQVVPDNMVVVCEQPIIADLSFDLPMQPVRPFWVMDYLSDFTNRKDYDDNRRQYEHALKVPYYLRFHCETKALHLYRHTGDKYVLIQSGENGRYAVPELEMELKVQDGWVKYWYQGKLLRSPAELQAEIDSLRRELAELDQRK